MDEHGYVRPFIVMPSERLKGGTPKVATPLPPKPATHEADCPCNLCYRKPINRRKPPDRKVPMGPAAPSVMARLQALAKARKRMAWSRISLGKGSTYTRVASGTSVAILSRYPVNKAGIASTC